MAKRFTDTNKWDHSWFRKLSPKLKCAWIYLVDKCDNAGVWNVDLEAMSFHIGETITEQDLDVFAAKLQELSFDKILIPSFIEFQYGKLSEECKPHKPVIERLKKLNLLKGYQKGFKTLEEKEEDKEKEKDKEKEEEEGGVEKPTLAEIENLYALYPRKEGKTKGLAKAKSIFKTRALLAEGLRAVTKYREHHETKGTQKEFLKHFDTFMSSWRDPLDEDFGSSTITSGRGFDIDSIELLRKNA